MRDVKSQIIELGYQMETAGVTTKITKSNSTPTPIRKVKDQPLQQIPINGTEEIIQNLG